MLKPLKNKYIVEPISIYGETKSGIYTAGSQKDLPIKGVVISAGGSQAVVGDIVHIKKYTWKEFWYDGKDLICIKNEDILAIERGSKVIAPEGSVLVKIEYAEKDGKIYLPDSCKTVRADIRAEVFAVHSKSRYRIYPGDQIVIVRITDGAHEGRVIDTSQGKLWSVYEKWVEGVYV